MPSIAPRTQPVKSVIGFRFRALPSEVMASRTLSSTAKLLFAAIVDAARGNRSGLCKIANATLGERIGRSESEVGRCLLELEAAGLVRREFGQSKNVRVGVAVTWSESVPQERGTDHPSIPQVQAPGSASTGNQVPQVWGPGRTVPVRTEGQTGQVLEVSGEKTEPKPSPQVVAAAIREMIGGKHGAKLFDPSTTPTPSTGQPQPPDVQTMARRVGYSARAAIVHGSPPRKSQAQQLAELAATRHRRESTNERSVMR